MIKKNGWSKEIMYIIEWKFNAKYIKNHSNSKRKALTKYCHRWLSSGSKNFRQKLKYPNCNKIDNKNMDHDYFLQCEAFEERKKSKIKNRNIIPIKTQNTGYNHRCYYLRNGWIL